RHSFGVGAIASVEAHLPAAGLAHREVNFAAQPLQHLDGRHTRVRIDHIDDARYKQTYPLILRIGAIIHDVFFRLENDDVYGSGAMCAHNVGLLNIARAAWPGDERHTPRAFERLTTLRDEP